MNDGIGDAPPVTLEPQELMTGPKWTPAPPTFVMKLDPNLDPKEMTEAGGRQTMIEQRFDLLPPNALREIAGVLFAGAEEYGVRNWERIDIESHLNHAIAHQFAAIADRAHPKSDIYNYAFEILELSHAACRALFALELAIQESRPR